MSKKILVSFITFLFFYVSATTVFAFNSEDAIGVWNTSKDSDSSQVTIYKENNKYYGKLTRLKDPESLDDKNPDESKRKNKLLGLIMVKEFHFKDGKWLDGFIYDPKNGKTYDCKMWLEDIDTLNVKGTIGPKWIGIGRTTTWYKVK